MKGEMSVASTRLPSSALTFTASGTVAISSRPSPGTYEGFKDGIPLHSLNQQHCSTVKDRLQPRWERGSQGTRIACLVVDASLQSFEQGSLAMEATANNEGHPLFDAHAHHDPLPR